MKNKLIGWIESDRQDLKEGLVLLVQLEGNHTTFLRKNDDAKKGSYAHNLLKARIERQIRLLSQTSKKKQKPLINSDIEQKAKADKKAKAEKEAKAKEELEMKAKKETEIDEVQEKPVSKKKK
ncbi:MAG: hypothetical protein B6I17_04545 [Tenericutes bacterium 4572_104]|nr:MAG: hypothetical protein B6I17_04545 [Tenericutes bacterium 4572_104]